MPFSGRAERRKASGAPNDAAPGKSGLAHFGTAAWRLGSMRAAQPKSCYPGQRSNASTPYLQPSHHCPILTASSSRYLSTVPLTPSAAEPLLANMAVDSDSASSAPRSGDRLLQSSGFKFDKAAKKSKIKLKKAPSEPKSVKVVNGAKKDNATSTSSSPVVPQFDKDTLNNFPTGKLDSLDTMICKHCKKVVLRRTAKEHVAGCLKSKQEKARKKKEAREAAQRAKERAERGDDDDEDEEEGKDGKGKKRKAEDDDKDKEPKKKKKKEEPKPKQAKAKGPVDVERQCGVQLPNGAQCARSLTCKSHSMGAKRAVPGRSLPYDMLLANYQKKNQARQQKAAIDANAPLQEEDLDTTLTGPVDSDEERDAVMTAVSRSLSRPQPLVTHTIFPTRRKYQLIRMKEMLSNALNGNRNSNMFGVPRDASAPVNGDTFAMPSAVPNSAASTSTGMAQPGIKVPNRKPSVDPT